MLTWKTPEVIEEAGIEIAREGFDRVDPQEKAALGLG